MWLAVLTGCGATPSHGDVGGDVGAQDAPMAVDDAGVDAAPEPPLMPEQICPGRGCERNNGDLWAGASAVPITPEPGTFDLVYGADGMLDDDPFFDPGRDNDRIVDTNGNGRLDPAWIAGFGMGRPAIGVRNDQWARALALKNGDTLLVFCVVDTVGYMINHMDEVRSLLPTNLGVDYVVMAATHTHEARDTVGIWGPDPATTGLDPDYMRLVRERSAQAIREAVERLAPVRVEAVSFFLRHIDEDLSTPGVQPETRRYLGDNRDPYIIDDQIRVLRFIRRDGGEAPGTPPTPDASGTREPPGPRSSTVATLINFASHPEYEGSRERLLSSDFVHWLRIAVERGADGPDADEAPDLPGLGGIAIFWNGPLGSQIGPNKLLLRSWSGEPLPDEGPIASQHVGLRLGYRILQAFFDEVAFPRRRREFDGSDFPISFRRARFTLRVQNTAYHIAFRSGLFDRPVYNYDPSRPISFQRNSNIPDIITELMVIRLGPIQMFTIPGELDPLLFVGIHNERAYTPPSYNGGNPVAEDPEDPLTLPMEEIPHVLQLRDEDVERDDVWLLGLTNDFLGYFVPEFDYKLHPTLPFLVRASRRHYEETNSLGPEAWPRLWRKLVELVRHRSP
ncbi:MAG: hypothetical protein NZM37_03625 [Sandaracinaceae bacterium]|nr:hypothetical protein [Sandaracinaceae bacterium]